MKQIDYDNCFSDDVYNLKNKFSLIKEVLIKIFSFITTIPILFIFFNAAGIIVDKGLMFDFFFYYFITMIPLDIYNIKKIKRNIKEKNEEAQKELNKLVYRLQKENVYINIDSLKKSIKKEKIDSDNNIITRFYMLDTKNQIKVLEEIKRMAIFKYKEKSLNLLDNQEIDVEEISQIKKFKSKTKF